MLWIVQNNLYNEAGYVRFIEALDRLELEYLVIKPIPFTNQFLPADFDSATQEVDDVEEPFIDTSKKVLAFGATSLSRIAKARGWNPGTYHNENFDYSIWREGFGWENILNGDAGVGAVHEMINSFDGDWLFVRPVEDTKAFTGMVMSCYDLHDWLQSISMIEEEEFSPLHRNTEIMISSAKPILAEYRLFVVDGKVVTSSLYKQGNQTLYREDADDDVLEFAAEMINKWQPATAFVLDIARTDWGLKVIEINTINSAGFYAADVQKIIMALEELEA